MTPMTSMRITELLVEAGLPEGVVNIVTCSRREIDLLIQHPAVKGVSFVGSTPVGRIIYEKAAVNGKRVQILCGAKNHALVMEDTQPLNSLQELLSTLPLAVPVKDVWHCRLLWYRKYCRQAGITDKRVFTKPGCRASL